MKSGSSVLWLRKAQSTGSVYQYPTVQKILIHNDAASVHDRWLKVEERHLGTGVELTAEQVAQKEQHVISYRRGELLCQDIMSVKSLKGVGKDYLHAGVDTFAENRH